MIVSKLPILLLYLSCINFAIPFHYYSIISTLRNCKTMDELNLSNQHINDNVKVSHGTKRSLDELSNDLLFNENMSIDLYNDITFPPSLRKHLENKIIWALEEISINDNNLVKSKQDVAQRIVDNEAMQIFHETLVPASEKRRIIRDKLDVISRALRSRIVSDSISSIDNILELNIQLVYSEHMEYNSQSQKVFESIAVRHENIKHKDWENVILEDSELENYKDAAHFMGQKAWVKNGLEWMKNVSLNFFYSDKYKKKVKHTSMNEGVLIKLLDIGSCFNPFLKFPEFCVKAIDLCPANSNVDKCDFLRVIISNTSDESTQYNKYDTNGFLECLPYGYFDVTVMSLVLCYLPDPQQRLKMIINARKCLNNNRPSLLLIFEKESILHSAKYYSNFLKHWKETICQCGFKVLCYEKLSSDNHIAHAFAFITTEVIDDDLPKGLFIRQDFDKQNIAKANVLCDNILIEKLFNIK